MTKLNKVLWSEGMFLLPQHFQQQDLYHEYLHVNAAQLSGPFAWGLQELEIDHDALKLSTLQVTRLKLRFPDGTVVDAPHRDATPAARNLGELVGAGSQVVIYAALPLLDPSGANCRAGDASMGALARYRQDHATTYDLFHAGGAESEIPVARNNVVLLLEGDPRDGYTACPIARLTRNSSGSFSVDAGYIPPSLNIGAASHAVEIVRRLVGILRAKSDALSGQRRERTRNAVEFGSADVSAFWLLHTVNSAFPVLQHYLAHPAIHPEKLFLALSQLAGGLLTFTTSGSLDDLPVYRHEEPGRVLDQLDALIRELLETVIPTRYVPIPLQQTKPSYFVGRINDERLIGGADFYVSISAAMPTAQLIEAVPRTFKVGSPDDIEVVVNSAMPGVRLVHMSRLPAAIPVRLDNHYFALEPQGAVFKRMMEARAVALYVPKAFTDLKLELMAVLK